MRDFAGMGTLDVWYARLEMDELLAQLRSQVKKGQLKRAEKTVAKARTKDSMTAFSKLTEMVDGEPRIVSDPPLIERVEDMSGDVDPEVAEASLRELLRRYRQSLQSDRRILLEEFRLVDLARKVVGVGSVGTRAWIALMLGRDEGDPLFLQFKEAESSVLEDFTAKSGYANHGERVVAGQHLMQASSDIFLGWLHVEAGLDGVARDFYGRQLKDWKGSFETAGACPRAWASTAGCVAGRLPEPTPAREIGSRSRPILGEETCSTERSPTSRFPTLIRTRVTTPRSKPRSTMAGSLPRPVSETIHPGSEICLGAKADER